jgi:hypothetical protein
MKELAAKPLSLSLPFRCLTPPGTGYNAHIHIGSGFQYARASPAENATARANNGDGTSNLRRTGASQ